MQGDQVNGRVSCRLQDCVGSTNVRLGVTLLAAAAHLAQTEASTGAVTQLEAAAGSGTAGFHGEMCMPADFTAALAWPRMHGASAGAADISPSAVRWELGVLCAGLHSVVLCWLTHCVLMHAFAVPSRCHSLLLAVMSQKACSQQLPMSGSGRCVKGL